MDASRTGRLASRLARGAPHGLAFLLATAILGLVSTRLPGPVVDRMVETDLRAAALVWQSRILRELRAGARTFTTGALAAEDQAFLASITRASDIHRINLYDAGGRIFWSSRAGLIGTLHQGAHFAENVVRGDAHYETGRATPSEIDDFDLHALPSDQGTDRTVAEIDHPVFLDGRVVGDIEFHRDVTGMRAAAIGRLRAMLVIVSSLALGMMGVASLLLLRATGAQTLAAEARAESQARLVAEQARLAREVRLLGELNEWLQSSRSLPELFAMVARFMAHMLPGASGSLYVYSNSRDVLDGAASWNGASHDDHIRPEDCWGLRRGRTYAFGGGEVDFACGHVHFDQPRPYLCMPILAHGDTVGLMTLTRKANTGAADFEAQRRIAQTCAEQVSLAIANVRMRDELQHQAVRDPLTGLFNRRHMLDALRRLIDQRHPGGVSVVSVDVDHFKRFNDAHGHDAGDVVLRSVAEVMARHAGEEGVACRVGGEELILVMPGLGSAEAAARAEGLRRDVATLAVRYGDKVLPRVTISVGVASHPDQGAHPQEVIRAADDALYLAKARGRNLVVRAGALPRPAETPDYGGSVGGPEEAGWRLGSSSRSDGTSSPGASSEVRPSHGQGGRSVPDQPRAAPLAAE